MKIHKIGVKIRFRTDVLALWKSLRYPQKFTLLLSSNDFRLTFQSSNLVLKIFKLKEKKTIIGLPLNPNETAWAVIIRSGFNDTLSVIDMSTLCDWQSEWLKRWVERRSQWFIRSWPVCIIKQRSPAFRTMSLLQKLEFLIIFLFAIDMNSFFAFGTAWIWIRRHDFLKLFWFKRVARFLQVFRLICTTLIWQKKSRKSVRNKFE